MAMRTSCRNSRSRPSADISGISARGSSTSRLLRRSEKKVRNSTVRVKATGLSAMQTFDHAAYTFA